MRYLPLLPLLTMLLSTRAFAGGWPSLDKPPTPQGGGQNDAAVIVGIEDYATAPKIAGAVENANAWYAYLTQSRRVPAARVKLLRNNEGTLEKIRKAVAEAAGDAKAGGTLWFVFIGHGAPAPDGKDGVLVGFDAQQDAESLYARSLPEQQVLAALDKGAQKRTMVILDACFSGRAGGGQQLVKNLQPMIPVRAALKSTKALVFTAGKPDQFAGPLPGANRPAFSYLMLGALRGWADKDGDATVTPQEAHAFVANTMAAVIKDHAQTPEVFGKETGDALAFAAAEPAPELPSLVLGTAHEEKRGADPLVELEKYKCKMRWGVWSDTKGECEESIVVSPHGMTRDDYPALCPEGFKNTCSCWSVIAAMPALAGTRITFVLDKTWCAATEAEGGFEKAYGAIGSVRAEWWGGTDGTMKCAKDYSPCIYVDTKAAGGKRNAVELGCCPNAGIGNNTAPRGFCCH